MMVQAGITHIYYFPAKDVEVDWNYPNSNEPQLSAPTSPNRKFSSVSLSSNYDKAEANYRSVSRLISNNPISLTLYIPRWSNTSEKLFSSSDSQIEPLWTLDPHLSSLPGLRDRWDVLSDSFKKTQVAIMELMDRFHEDPKALIHPTQNRVLDDDAIRLEYTDDRQTYINIDTLDKKQLRPISFELMKHAMILAHIVSKRTDDAKIGVGSVIVKDGKYISVGWNGYPRRSATTDYPQAGADDSLDDEALKYDYVLHAGIYSIIQNKMHYYGDRHRVCP